MKNIFRKVCIAAMLAVSMLSGCSAPSLQSAVNTSGIFENNGTEQKENVDVSSNTEQEKFEEVKLDTEYSVEDFADFIVKKVETTKKVYASMGSGLYYENNNDGETYVDVVLEYTNISTEDQDSEECVVLTAKDESNIEYSSTLYAVENGDDISRYEKISPLSKVRLHCAVSVPEKTNELTLYLTAGEKVYSYQYTLGEMDANIQELKPGEKLEKEDFASITYLGMEYTDDLLPPNTSGSYTHYPINNKDNTYLVIKFDIANNGSVDRDIEQFIGMKAVYAEKYTYTGFVVKEDDDGSGFDKFASLSPLETGRIYFLIEVPKVVTKESGIIQVVFDGNEYQADISVKK